MATHLLAGADIKEFYTIHDRTNDRMKDKTYHEVVRERFIASWQDMTRLQKPIIAAVNGYAVTPLL
jgi:enoyl-CoA hydratase